MRIKYIPVTELLKNEKLPRMARELKIPYNTLYRYKMGQREPSAENYVKIYNDTEGREISWQEDTQSMI